MSTATSQQEDSYANTAWDRRDREPHWTDEWTSLNEYREFPQIPRHLAAIPDVRAGESVELYCSCERVTPQEAREFGEMLIKAASITELAAEMDDESDEQE